MTGNIKARLETLLPERVFNKRELIIDRWENGMTTIRKEADDQIRIINYELIENNRKAYVRDSTYKNIGAKDKIYDAYKKMLEDKGLW